MQRIGNMFQLCLQTLDSLLPSHLLSLATDESLDHVCAYQVRSKEITIKHYYTD